MSKLQAFNLGKRFLACATVAPEGVVTLGYRVLNPDGSLHSGAAEIYFETTGGYLPLARSVTNGQGILSIKAQNMTPGQSFKAKCERLSESAKIRR